MFAGTPKQIYEKVFEVLSTDASLSYFETCQKGFYPRSENLVNPTLYPWVFIEFGGYGGISSYRVPRVWEYEFTIPMVAMTIADKGDPTSLVFNDGTNEKKGIGDIIADIGAVFWQRKIDQFGIEGVNDWNISRVGTPSVLSVQRLLVNPFVRGVQMDFSFQIIERD